MEQTCLVNDTDAWEVDDDRATLMTLHAAKGLEFPVVFIVAVEEGLLPHERSRDWLDQIEEERRLLFVGITRAREELQLSLANYRSFRGQRRLTIPSPFLTELPVAEMDVQDFSWAAPVAWPQDRRRRNARFNATGHEDEIVLDPGSASPATVSNGVRLITAAQLSAGQTGTLASAESPALEQVTSRLTRRIPSRNGGPTSTVRPGQDHRAVGQRPKAHRDGRVCTGRRREAIHPVSFTAAPRQERRLDESGRALSPSNQYLARE